jgi:hypothetical protein
MEEDLLSRQARMCRESIDLFYELVKAGAAFLAVVIIIPAFLHLF